MKEKNKKGRLLSLGKPYDMEKAHNKLTDDYRMKRHQWNKDGTFSSVSIPVNKSIHNSLSNRKVPPKGSSEFWFTSHPYKFYRLRLIWWSWLRFTKPFRKWSINEENLKYIITTSLFLAVNIVGWIIAIYYKC